jgi:hypothetical protein
MRAGAAASLRSREGRIALALAGVAGLRVLLCSLAFPFFSNIDEYRHVDVVLKYAAGTWPTPGPDRYEPETGRLIGRFGSPEYHRDPAAPAPPPPPPWRQPDAVGEARVARMQAFLADRHSLEADQPPVYYALAGAWLALGRGLGLEGAGLLYWVRVLGAAAAFATVLACWVLLREVYTGSALVRLGVPLLLAFLPQDAMTYVTGDALSPLLGGIAFLLALGLTRHPAAGAGAYAGAGLVAAAAFLCKYPNAAVLVGCGFCTAVALAASGEQRGSPRRWALFWACALAPALFWLLRNQWLGGDLTGTAFKVERLGWGRKPLAEILDHPLFTPAGAWTFLTGLVPKFWRGELAWYRDTLAWRPADLLYLGTTLVLVPLAALGVLRASRPRAERVAEGAALVATLTAVATLALLSLLFVFHETSSPSSAYPYFTEGRLISGVLVPFALLYVRGIEEATARLPARWAGRAGWALLGAVVAMAAFSEVVLTAPVFRSDYNWFHLP